MGGGGGHDCTLYMACQTSGGPTKMGTMLPFLEFDESICTTYIKKTNIWRPIPVRPTKKSASPHRFWSQPMTRNQSLFLVGLSVMWTKWNILRNLCSEECGKLHRKYYHVLPWHLFQKLISFMVPLIFIVHISLVLILIDNQWFFMYIYIYIKLLLYKNVINVHNLVVLRVE